MSQMFRTLRKVGLWIIFVLWLLISYLLLVYFWGEFGAFILAWLIMTAITVSIFAGWGLLLLLLEGISK